MTHHYSSRILKNKIYTFINISGLMLGITILVLIATWTNDELSIKKQGLGNHTTAIFNQPLNHKTKPQNNVSLSITEGLRISFGTSFELVVFSGAKENEQLRISDKKFVARK